MNATSTHQNKIDEKVFNAEKVSKALLELAESHLKCPENSLYISEKGIDKVRKKLVHK